jgi:putative endonuclease
MFIFQRVKKIIIYILGQQNNLERRIEEHNSGLVFSTKHRIPFELIYYEAYKPEKDARYRERKSKNTFSCVRAIKEKAKRKFIIMKIGARWSIPAPIAA